MKKKILWMFLSFLLVAALVLASCAKEVVEEEEEEEEEAVVEEEVVEEEVVEPPVGEPQYGGKLTYIIYPFEHEGNPDPANWEWPGKPLSSLVLEHFRKGDLEKYGVRGTGEYDFRVDKQAAFEYFRGGLAESWEVTADKIIFHIRPGVYWAAEGKEHVMESREYTAHDFVFNLNRLLDPESVQGGSLRAANLIKSVDAEDPYTVVVETNYFHPEWWWQIGGSESMQIPPEVVEAGPEDWANLVGTGPFMVKEQNPGVAMHYERNPNYWDTTTINGVEYELPFVDEVVIPIIMDFATVLSALRTGVLDAYYYVQPVDVEALKRTNPELLGGKVRGGNFYTISLRMDRPPLDDINIRRALMMGTDREAIHKAAIITGDTWYWPLAPGVLGHLTLEELPADVRELFEYNPEKARQMIADVYPDGLKLQMEVDAIRLDNLGIAEMTAGMWEENLNVEVEFTTYDATGFGALRDAKEVQEMISVHRYSHLAFWCFPLYFETGGKQNDAMYSNPVFDELLAKAGMTVDVAERQAMLEELFVMALRDVPYIPFGTKDWHVMWWPWVKNYYGESMGIGWDLKMDTLWLDQDLKAEMGY